MMPEQPLPHDTPSSEPNGHPASPEESAPVHAATNLTTSQFLMWVGQATRPEVPLYNMVLTFEITGDLNVSHFKAATQALLDRSDALRTVVELKGGGPTQRVRPPGPFDLEVVDLTVEADPDAALEAWVDERRAQTLDLSERLFDMALIRLGADRHVWYLNQHHIITDIWSVSLIYQQVNRYYRLAHERQLGEASSLPPFADYVAHEQAFRDSDASETVEAYWQSKRDELPAPPRLYGHHPERETTRTERVRRTLTPAMTDRLEALVQRDDLRALTPDLTRYSIVAAVLFAFLHRVSGQRDLAIGTPSHNRATETFKDTIGLFIEVFPMAATVASDDTFATLVKRVQHEAVALLRHAQPGTSTAAANRSYNVLLNYLPVSLGSTFGELPMTPRWVHSGHGDSSHHLRVQVHDLAESGAMHFMFDFNASLFGESEREAAADHFMRLLRAALDAPDQRVAAPGLLDSDQERALLTAGRPATTSANPASVDAASVDAASVDAASNRGPSKDDASSVVGLFEAQATATPDAPAVTCDNDVLTYRELKAEADRWAGALRERGIGAETRVALHVTRSLEAVVAILAVLKAGGTYVPLDLNHPTKRQAAVLDDAEVPWVITRDALPDGLDDPTRRALSFERLRRGRSDGAKPLPDGGPAAHHAAYVLYTSGSTGQPKGVVVEHGALAQYLTWARRYYLGGTPGDCPLFTSLAVDLTVTSLFMPLVTGGRVIVYREAPDPATLLRRVVHGAPVDVLKMTPSHAALVQHLDVSPEQVRSVILGGEALATTRADQVLATFGDDTTVYNEYGPTEATVGCVAHRYDPASDTGDTVPIGLPAAQARVYVLDDALNLTPPGVAGTLHVAGPGLARGYLNRPDNTAARFVGDPFQPGARMYRTGDRVRWHHGRLEYLGRADDQVQIGGARVELGEIEAELHKHSSINAAAVAVTAASHQDEPDQHCARCGLPSNYPGSSFNANGVCHLCRAFDRYEERVEQYFRDMDDLRSIFDTVQARRLERHGTGDEAASQHKGGPEPTAQPQSGESQHGESQYDCLMLLSGGKDSTYALARLVDMGLNVLTFTLANGYISDEAKANIRRVTSDLGVDHVFGETPAMDAIFADSLARFSNVCNGCFKTIYTLALKEAQRRSIPIIVTGLSRGQFFETRLTEDLFLGDEVDAHRIDEVVLEARKAYHRVDDAVSRHLDVADLQDGSIFDQVRFVDFYRYCDVSLSEMMDYLDERLPWVRPTDTGRSTNCLINEVGIYVHKKERGYHNYAFPYSWDVRIGHKTREETLNELDDDIDEENARRILREIGYDSEALRARRATERLAAYYVSDTSLPAADLRHFLSERLPSHMVPTHFIRLDKLPLNATGKVDRSALPQPDAQRPDLDAPYEAPRTDVEQTLARIWTDVLDLQEVGIHDNFFDLGGESIRAIQIGARASEAGLNLAPEDVFQHQSIAELATAAEPSGDAEPAPLGDGPLSDPTPRPDSTGDAASEELAAPSASSEGASEGASENAASNSSTAMDELDRETLDQVAHLLQQADEAKDD